MSNWRNSCWASQKGRIWLLTSRQKKARKLIEPKYPISCNQGILYITKKWLQRSAKCPCDSRLSQVASRGRGEQDGDFSSPVCQGCPGNTTEQSSAICHPAMKHYLMQYLQLDFMQRSGTQDETILNTSIFKSPDLACNLKSPIDTRFKSGSRIQMEFSMSNK